MVRTDTEVPSRSELRIWISLGLGLPRTPPTMLFPLHLPIRYPLRRIYWSECSGSQQLNPCLLLHTVYNSIMILVRKDRPFDRPTEFCGLQKIGRDRYGPMPSVRELRGLVDVTPSDFCSGELAGERVAAVEMLQTLL